jgi:dipeptidyl aminopeptidase/acylaminoacyl peptidase
MRMRTAALALGLTLPVTAGLLAQSAATRAEYLTPPKAIVDILNAEPLPAVTVGPARETIALMSRLSMPSIEEVSQPMLRLAGLRINPSNNGPHRIPSGTSITLRNVVDGAERKVSVPAGARIADVDFSPDGRRLFFTNTREDRVDLYIADTATGQSRMIDAPLNAVGSGCTWLSDGSAVLCGFIPAARGPAPAAPKAPSGPNIQENFGKPGPVRTYQDLLTSAHDEDLFEYYTTAQLGLVDAATGRMTPLGRPGMYDRALASPGGEYFLVERTKRPFSRLLTRGEFPADVEIWSRKGEKVRTVADVPMGDTVPINGVITGPRSYEWHPLEPATLVWVEALDKGDLKNDVPHRDRIMAIAAPFSGEPKEVAKTEYRYAGVSWTDDGTIMLNESDRATRTVRSWLLTSSWAQPRKLWERKQQDAYSDPGTPLSRPGKGTILQSGDNIYLVGQGASPEGNRPFLDRLNLKTLATERIFRSDATTLETVVGLLEPRRVRCPRTTSCGTSVRARRRPSRTSRIRTRRSRRLNACWSRTSARTACS